MISTRLKNIFALSIPVFIAHGPEEYFTGFYNEMTKNLIHQRSE